MRKTARHALGIGPTDPVVLVPAVLRAGKGHDVLLEAVPELRRRVPAVRVLLAGGGELESELRTHAAGLGDAVSFLGARGDMPELFAASDVVVLPSLSEALPTALMEAAAAGRPVVATRVGGVPEVVQHDRTGLLVPAGDAAALTEALARLLIDKRQAAACGAAARTLARERFGIDRQVAHTLSLWRRIVERRTA